MLTNEQAWLMDSKLDRDQNSLSGALYFPQLLTGLGLASEWEAPPEWCGRMEGHGNCPGLGGRVPHSHPGSAPSTWASLGQQLCRLSETQFTCRLKQEPAGRRARERPPEKMREGRGKPGAPGRFHTTLTLASPHPGALKMAGGHCCCGPLVCTSASG